jgi:hypothetical protein
MTDQHWLLTVPQTAARLQLGIDGLSRRGTAARRLQDEALRVFREHKRDGALPTSNRFIFYELVQRGVLDKAKKRGAGSRGADQDLSDAITRLHEVGLVPEEWSVDETRELHDREGYSSLADAVLEAVEYAPINCWGDMDPPLLLCESRTFGGVLDRTLTREYRCSASATNGQVRGHLHTKVAPKLANTNRPVLYIGDWDHSGRQIEENTRSVLVRAADGWSGEWTRIALTDAQVEARPALRDLAITKYDNRYRDKKPHLAIEVEALGQTVVTEIVRRALDELLPETLADVQVREAKQRRQWRLRLEKWRRS